MERSEARRKNAQEDRPLVDFVGPNEDMSRLCFLPCLDSKLMAAHRRRELDLPRDFAAGLGHSAVTAARDGHYLTRNGRKVNWQDAVKAASAGAMSVEPDAALPRKPRPSYPETRVQVRNETTLAAALQFVERGLRPVALNFANGIHPGGGFLNGARAQEEVLCRSSALFHTLIGSPMYAAHANRELPDSTDWAIYSPDVPVFRADDGTILPQPWLLSFITCAAPYAPSVGQPRSGDLLQKRIHRVLAIAHANGHAELILGAWGCGAFGNDPTRTARDFRQALEGDFRGAFSDVVFAVTDWSSERRILGPFRDAFAA